MIADSDMRGSSDGNVPDPATPTPPNELLSTLDLLERFKLGDEDAVTILVERSLPPLRRWARGRLPVWARSLAETQDLVQTALMRALPRLKEFEVRHAGALQAYLRQAVANHIRDEVRKASTRQATELADVQPDPGPSPLEQAIGREAFDRYCGRATAKRSWRASSCSKATRKWPSRSTSRTPTRRAWRWPEP
jgi:DNA-directed RNA polymerase specialized sigma24 family protein